VATTSSWWRRARRWPGTVWGSSLPLRVIVTTLVASILVLALGAWMILWQATSGIVSGKTQLCADEAGSALTRMQDQLRDADLRSTSLLERLQQLANEANSQAGAQYQLVIEGLVAGFSSRGISADSVPGSLRDTVKANPDAVDVLWHAPTTVVYTAPGTPDDPGIAFGGTLHAPTGQGYAVYFVFPLSQEAATVAVLRGAVLSTVTVLIAALALIAYAVSRQFSRPVRLASEVAGQIAAGDFERRLPVKGTDDLASLATSMNNMAGELATQIARLEDLSRVQQRFVSDVSHELRTPLTTVRMASEVLYSLREDFSPTASRTVELLQAEIDRFSTLLADLLEISRFDAGAALLSLEEVDVVEVVRAEVAELDLLSTGMGTPLVLHASPRIVAEIDVRRVRRVLRNLMTNAIEHGERRPIDIDLAADEHAVAVSVRDRGVGFAPEQAQLVFQRFWRADPSRQRTVGGTGLGLAIALEDARLHGGWLQAWGRPGRGAVFRLTLPLHPGDPLRTSPLPLRPADRSGTQATSGEEAT